MLLRGIWYRRGRAAVVVVLAAIAVAAAVLAPAYTRAAQQSVLTDELSAAPASAAAATVTSTGTAALAPLAHEPPAALAAQLAPAAPGVTGPGNGFAAAVTGSEAEVALGGGPLGAEPLASRLVYRDQVCTRLAITGACPSGDDELLVSDRLAAEHGVSPGDEVAVDLGDQRTTRTVVGTYRPLDPAEPYWGRHVYFAYGGYDPTTGAPRVDAVFTGDPAAVTAAADATVTSSVTYPLEPSQIRLAALPELRAELDQLHHAAGAAGAELTTELPALLDDVAQEQRAIGQTAPLVAVPLVLLAGLVLLRSVRAVVAERSHEIGLAKLRGYPNQQAARFGLGEVLVLVAAAGPIGLGIGLLTVELVARLSLAPGTGVELRWPVVGAVLGAVAAALLGAGVAAWSTLQQGTLDLLRRVPRRRGRRLGPASAAVAALSVAAVAVLLTGDRTTPLALLAPALLGILAGIAVAGWVSWRAAHRLRWWRERGRLDPRGLPALLAAAQLARQNTGRQTIVVVTVAVALLSFAAIGWDVAAQARSDRAIDQVGADRVYTVHADHPTALREAVAAADPTGRSMPVVRTNQQYAGGNVELLAVASAALPQVAQWRGQDAAAQTSRAAALRPSPPVPLPVADRLTVTAEVTELAGDPVRLTALLSTPGHPPRAVSLGTLALDRSSYSARVPECATGCRLLGLTLGSVAVAGAYQLSVAITGISSGDTAVAAEFTDPQRWQAPADVQVGAGSALTVTVADGHTDDVSLTYLDRPAAVPVVLAGDAPAEDPAAEEFRFPGLSERPEPFVVVDRVPHAPRAGERALLVDLDYAVAAAERTTALADHGGLRYEVWAARDAPADLPERLADQGVTVGSAETLTQTGAQLGRAAPALGLRLGLLAAGAAVALAVAAMMLSTQLARRERAADAAALGLAGVGDRVLRRAVWREYAALTWPALVGGVTAGIAAAALVLPGLPLVTAGSAAAPSGLLLSGWAGLRWAPVAVAATAIGLLATAALAAGRAAAGGGVERGSR
ncbi:hypothetical protein JQS43_06170 [Natronosporangium hydrolyticum]|uniref:ABC3 transporter permease C-terminal domain-containing protein n=1 Tax=Natronosporangium hydrolyticum TaxID=2811111 RepID=A0A895YIU7_9ACTN|nr:FtsX-like permease family protein [Natronosporangium hydrolyticum]QSB15915.1 hypothetical protein JQS43_06170 [Natronosporangium hydrolyticum]